MQTAFLPPLSACGASDLPRTLFLSLIRARVRSGQNLTPSYYGAKANNTLKAILAKQSVPHAIRYRSHSIRRVAANELKTKGAQLSTVSTIGDWRSIAFRGYVDLTAELGRATPRLLAATDEVDAADELTVRTLGAWS